MNGKTIGLTVAGTLAASSACVLDHKTWHQDERHAGLGKTLDDAAIWDTVAFIRKMPDMTSETYQQLSQEHSG
jgi:hypothetical protein